MTLQAFIDDSADAKRSSVFVLGGYVAKADAWASFSQEWKDHLKLCNLRRFKLNEFAKDDTWKIASFYRIIENHDIPFSLDCMIDIKMLKKCIEATNWNGADKVKILAANPYFLASKISMIHLFKHSDDVGLDGPIDLIFDEQSEKTILMDAWDYFKECAPTSQQVKMENAPVFENEETILPLQAADLIAGYVRRAEEKESSVMKNAFPWDQKKQIPRLTSRFNEDGLMKELAYIFSQENYEKSKASYLTRSA